MELVGGVTEVGFDLVDVLERVAATTKIDNDEIAPSNKQAQGLAAVNRSKNVMGDSGRVKRRRQAWAIAALAMSTPVNHVRNPAKEGALVRRRKEKWEIGAVLSSTKRAWKRLSLI